MNRLTLVNRLLEECLLEQTDTIKVEHPGILGIPPDKYFWQLPLKHYISLAKKKGKSAIMKALLNLERWNKNRNPRISKEARAIIDKLKRDSEWKNI